MSIELTRRDFIKTVFATASLAAVSSATTLWPANSLSRPIAEPIYLTIEDGYIVDAGFDYCDLELPTFREHHSLVGLGPAQLKSELEKLFDDMEHLVEDPENWSIDEVKEWLDSPVELDNLGLWEAMKHTHYGPGIEIYEKLTREQVDELGIELVDGDHPGSNFMGVAFHGDINELNKVLDRLAMNLIIS